ncbi:class I SAM-dependent methyltransferase [Desulfobulbus alkaliphilus]|uniref:class I SAM-dependent methyltransferase n=1 Tax=Desulfobulbus alkaliphilus TaxID=869814 RepID=UPI0019658B5E|nr:class I SAM-dependent methyltransferase [Desulfobulbus alkaliphilus]MBM9538349.1 class I SAM-dependent methyltransferase [Desulfobulbus alkaliphilus]
MSNNNDNYYNWYNKSESLRMFYPSEIVIGFLKNNLKEHSKVLDLGTGSGRHAILAAELGHDSHGLDLSDNGFDICYEMCRLKKVKAKLFKSYMDNTPFENSFFDAVVCISSIGGNTVIKQIDIINETFRILKRGGIFLVNFYGLNDGIYDIFKNKGVEIEERTLEINGNLFHSALDESIPNYTRHFSTEEEIENMFSDFSSIKKFEIYLPFGNANMNENVMPVHHIYVMARK